MASFDQVIYVIRYELYVPFHDLPLCLRDFSLSRLSKRVAEDYFDVILVKQICKTGQFEFSFHFFVNR